MLCCSYWFVSQNNITWYLFYFAVEEHFSVQYSSSKSEYEKSLEPLKQGKQECWNACKYFDFFNYEKHYDELNCQIQIFDLYSDEWTTFSFTNTTYNKTNRLNDYI